MQTLLLIFLCLITLLVYHLCIRIKKGDVVGFVNLITAYSKILLLFIDAELSKRKSNLLPYSV